MQNHSFVEGLNLLVTRHVLRTHTTHTHNTHTHTHTRTETPSFIPQRSDFEVECQCVDEVCTTICLIRMCTSVCIHVTSPHNLFLSFFLSFFLLPSLWQKVRIPPALKIPMELPFGSCGATDVRVSLIANTLSCLLSSASWEIEISCWVFWLSGGRERKSRWERGNC